MTPNRPPAADSPIDELVRRLVAARRPDRPALFDALIARTRQGYDSLAVFRQLAAVKPGGSRLALEYVARMPEPIPPAILLYAAKALEDRENPVATRLAVAGKLLASLPDTPQAVGPVVRSVCAGLSRSKTLQRMIELQSRVDRCGSLDRMVAEGEKTVKLRCPKCKAKLTRPAFIKHLWHKHRLTFDRGAAHDPRPAVETVVADASAPDAAADSLDTAFHTSPLHYPKSTLVQVLQAVASRQMHAGQPVPDTLTREAADAQCGLCPACLNPVPDPLPPVPQPLALGGGRLSGDGYMVEVIDSAAGRTIAVDTPKKSWVEMPTTRRHDPRTFAVLIAAPVLLAGILVVLLLPAQSAPPVLVAVVPALIAWAAYSVARCARKPLPRRDTVALDAAWQIVPDQMRKPKAAVRWLTRLCRASPDRGSELDRAKVLYELAESAAVWADKGGHWLPLFAAARVLQVSDSAGYGRDIANGLVDVFEPFFLGELPAAYAESAAEIILEDGLLTPADAKRLAVLLQAAAFESGLTPLDLVRVLRFLTRLRILMGTPTVDGLKLAYAVWKGGKHRPWEEAGLAASAFELARTMPGVSRRLLTANPDLLLRVELPDAAERELGEVVLTARGLVVSGRVLTDPDGSTELMRSPRGSGWMLALGSQKIHLDRKLEWEAVDLMVRWLRYRVTKLVPLAEATDRQNPDRVRRMLEPLVRDCRLCGAACLCRTGRVGEQWPLA